MKLRTDHLHPILICALAVALCSNPLARAEEPVPTALDTAEAAEYLGLWKLTLDLMGREMELFLDITDVDGKLGATMDSANQPEPQAIGEIEKSEGGLLMNALFKLRSFSIDIIIDMQKQGDELSGTIKDQSNLFNAEFVGEPITEEELVDEVQGRRPPPTEASATFPGNRRVRVTFGNIKTDHEDYQRFLALKPGEVRSYTSSRATKMFTDADLKFGDVVIESENVAENYPGVYSVWLKKAQDGWHLVFNSDSDVWGTARLPENDVAEIPLKVAEAEEPAEEFIIKIDKVDDDSGILHINWGNTHWMADFEVLEKEAEPTSS